MAIYITKHCIKFADGIHDLGEAIELNTKAAQTALEISDADVAQLLKIGAIELQVTHEPLLFDALTESTNADQVTDQISNPVKARK